MSNTKSSDQISIKDIVLVIIDWSKYFISHWKIILIAAIIGCGYGAYKAYKSKPIYTGEVTFAIDSKNAVNALAGIASQLGIPSGAQGNGAFAGENVIELFKSRNLIEKTLLSEAQIGDSKQLLVNRYIESFELRKEWNKKDKLKNIQFLPGEPRVSFGVVKDSLLGSIYKGIRASSIVVDKVDKKLTVISLKVESPDELFAKGFAEKLVENVSQFYYEVKTKKSRQNLQILERRLDSVRNELDIELVGAAVYRDRNFQVIKAQGSVAPKKREINVTILTTMYSELVKNIELAKFSLSQDEPLVQVIDLPVLPLNFAKLKYRPSIMLYGFGWIFLAFICLAGYRFSRQVYLDIKEDNNTQTLS